MKNKKLFTSVLAVVLAVVLFAGNICGTAPAVLAEKNSAQLKSELNELEAQKAEIDDKLAELEGQLSANLSEIQEIVAQKNVIDQEVFLLNQQVDNINNQIITYSSLIADSQDELDQHQARLAQLQEQNKERIRAMEKNGTLSYWSVIFKANDFGDLLDRLTMVQEIAEADRRRMKEMTEAAAAVAEAKAALETEKASLENTKEELKASEAVLAEKRADADKILAQLAAKGDEYEALVHAAEEDRAELKNQILDKEEEYDAAKDREYKEYLAQLQQQQKPNYSGGNAGTSNTVSGVTWLVPISYTRFSSPFGYRIHPIYGDWRFHYGVDLSAPQGTPIYASRSGVVNVASYEAGGAGYYVNIDHKDGFTTRYMHMTHYIVSPGQYVYAGQVIGYCGSTGASTGPHLHFSVYYNGVAVNPADYISI